jgi:transcriptional regulator
MYLPKAFEEQDPGRLRDFIRRYPLGTVVTQTTSGLDANHIPLLVAEPEGAAARLHGHIARANPLWRDVAPDAQTLVIFHGPNGFVSPSWYPGQCDKASVVPTWNYAVAHGHGRLRFVDDATWVRAHLEALTREHEANRDEPWAVTDAPAEFIDKLVTAVVGVEISVTRWYGKWKVSQNRSAADRLGVIDGLEREASASSVALAALVKETLSEG